MKAKEQLKELVKEVIVEFEIPPPPGGLKAGGLTSYCDTYIKNYTSIVKSIASQLSGIVKTAISDLSKIKKDNPQWKGVDYKKLPTAKIFNKSDPDKLRVKRDDLAKVRIKVYQSWLKLQKEFYPLYGEVQTILRKHKIDYKFQEALEQIYAPLAMGLNLGSMGKLPEIANIKDGNPIPPILNYIDALSIDYEYRSDIHNKFYKNKYPKTKSSLHNLKYKNPSDSIDTLVTDLNAWFKNWTITSQSNLKTSIANIQTSQTNYTMSKEKLKIKEIVKEVISEIISENHKFKVGDEVKFNGNYDGVVVKVHADGKLKGMIDVQKKGRSSTVTLSASNKKEVRPIKEDLFHCIQDLMKSGDARNVADKKCKRWGVSESDEELTEDGGTNIDVHALNSSEIQLAVGAINFFGTGSHPMADAKGLKYFKVEYLADIIVKNKSKLSGDAKKHLANLLKKLQKSIKEDSVTENKDINFVLDQLANSVDLYPRDEFAQHMAKNTKYDEKDFEKLYDAYFKMKAMDRFHMAIDIGKSKKFLSKFGIKEEVQPVNENMSDLEFVVDQLANSMEHYDEKEFVDHMSKETKYNANSLKKVFNAYWDLGARERDDTFTRINTAKPWLKKFGIKEEIQSINEGLWSGLKTRSRGTKGWKGDRSMAWGSGTSFEQILWKLSPKEGHLSRYQWDADGNIKQDVCYAEEFATGEGGLRRFYELNKDEGLDIEKDFPFKEVNRMRKAYRRIPVETQVKMATDTTHKLAMNFLAKYNIKP